MLLCGNAVVDVFTCTAKEDVVFDLPLHFRGTLEGLPDAVPCDPLAGDNGYQHIQEPQRFDAPIDTFSVDAGNGKRVHVACLDASTAYRAEAPGYGMRETLPLVLRRQEGRTARFLTVYQILGPDESPKAIEAQPGPETHVSVGDVQLRVGEQTVVKAGDKEYVVTRNGVE